MIDPHPALRDLKIIINTEVNEDYIIAVGTSKDEEGKVGIGIIVHTSYNIIVRKALRLSNNTNIDIAELVAIREGIKTSLELNLGEIILYTDRKGSIEAILNPNTKNENCG